jgi:hypothetical protein
MRRHHGGKIMKLLIATISLALSVVTNAEEAKSIEYTAGGS